METPYLVKGSLKYCSSTCTEKKPHEFAVSFGSSAIVARLSIGFEEKSYDLKPFRWKLPSIGKEKRYVKEHFSTVFS